MSETAAAENRKQTIEEILTRVRAGLETSEELSAASSAKLRRNGGITSIPLIDEPDVTNLIPLGLASYTIEDFAALDDEAFLHNAYRVVLGREMDGVGRAYYLPALRSGHVSVVRVLDVLRRSREGREHGTKIRWIAPAAILDRLSMLPVIGKFFAPFMQFIVRPTTNIRLATQSVRHQDLIASVNSSLSALRRSLAQIEIRLDVNERDGMSTLALTQDAIHNTGNSLAEIRATRGLIVDENRQLASLLERARDALPQDSDRRAAIDAMDDHVLDSLYVAFENRFRGTTAEIGRRSERYLPIFRHNGPVTAGGTVLDIGCGRGEFLSLLARNNIKARGIDLNVAMVAEARALGHEVEEGDAIAYLRSLPDQSLAGITGFHIVEHLPFKVLVALLDEARRCLIPGGLILFETPNPENIVVGACTFNYDPTHQKPLPPDLMHFLADARGFAPARIIRTDEDCDLDKPEVGFKPEDVNDWFRQPPDYALYAEKPVEAGQA